MKLVKFELIEKEVTSWAGLVFIDSGAIRLGIVGGISSCKV